MKQDVCGKLINASGALVERLHFKRFTKISNICRYRSLISTALDYRTTGRRYLIHRLCVIKYCSRILKKVQEHLTN